MDNLLRTSLIEAHRNWLIQFKAIIEDKNTIGVVDQSRIESHRECEFGYLLGSGKLVFESAFMEDVVRHTHATFHGIAALVIDLHNKNADKKEIAEYFVVLEQVSDQLTTLLKKLRVK
jgi:hypothetical protein